MDAICEPAGNTKVLGVSFGAFSLGFGVWGMFAALGPFLIKWFHYTPSQALFLAAMPPLFASVISIPLGAVTDRFGGRKVFTWLLLAMLGPLLVAPFVDTYAVFLVIGMLLGLGGASFVVGNAHVSSWYPRSRQGTALGIFALGNIGITLGMVFVPLLITQVLGGPVDDPVLPAKVTFAGLAGYRLIFLAFALPTAVMALVYWTQTSDAPHAAKHGVSARDIIAICRSSTKPWIIAFLYWVSFGTLTFFSAFAPTYLTDRWHVDGSQASMVYTSTAVVCVALMRPVGGWLSDRVDPLKLLTGFFGVSLVFAILLVVEVSFAVQMISILALALLSGAAAATVVKLIPMYFPNAVGTVSGLAKASGALCGFTMSTLMALSKNWAGGYTLGFLVWAVMCGGALLLALRGSAWGRVEVAAPPVAAPAPAFARVA